MPRSESVQVGDRCSGLGSPTRSTAESGPAGSVSGRSRCCAMRTCCARDLKPRSRLRAAECPAIAPMRHRNPAHGSSGSPPHAGPPFSRPHPPTRAAAAASSLSAFAARCDPLNRAQASRAAPWPVSLTTDRFRAQTTCQGAVTCGRCGACVQRNAAGRLGRRACSGACDSKHRVLIDCLWGG